MPLEPVDDLLGVNPFSNKVQTTSLCYFSKENANADGFWGHLGLLMYGQKETKWFPITLNTANHISKRLQCDEDDGLWVTAPTLNNKIIVFNPEKLRRIWLLDDACDAPDDWSEEVRNDYDGIPLEIYKALDVYFSDDDEEQEEMSEPVFADAVPSHAWASATASSRVTVIWSLDINRQIRDRMNGRARVAGAGLIQQAVHGQVLIVVGKAQHQPILARHLPAGRKRSRLARDVRGELGGSGFHVRCGSR